MILKFEWPGCCLILFLFHCAYGLIAITFVMDDLPNEVVYAFSGGIILNVHVYITCSQNLLVALLVCYNY